MNFSKGEEDLMEVQVKTIADSGANVIVTGGKVADMALHYANKYKLMVVRWERGRSFCPFCNLSQHYLSVFFLCWLFEWEFSNSSDIYECCLFFTKAEFKMGPQKTMQNCRSYGVAQIGELILIFQTGLEFYFTSAILCKAVS